MANADSADRIFLFSPWIPEIPPNSPLALSRGSPSRRSSRCARRDAGRGRGETEDRGERDPAGVSVSRRRVDLDGGSWLLPNEEVVVRTGLAGGQRQRSAGRNAGVGDVVSVIEDGNTDRRKRRTCYVPPSNHLLQRPEERGETQEWGLTRTVLVKVVLLCLAEDSTSVGWVRLSMWHATTWRGGCWSRSRRRDDGMRLLRLGRAGEKEKSTCGD